MKRIVRGRRLTAEEAANYRKIRSQIEQEKPEIEARIRARMAERGKKTTECSHEGTLGQRIRAAREARGETQVALAAAAGISQSYLSELEHDHREPTLSIAARLARALGMSLDELAARVA